MQKLTQIQANTFQYIKDFTSEHFYAPTIAEMAEHFEVLPNTIQERIYALVRKGALTKTRGKSRTLRPVKGFRIYVRK